MSTNQSLSTTLPVVVDSFEALCQFLDMDTYFPFKTHSSTNPNYDIGEDEIKKIYTDLTATKNLSDELYMLLLYLNEDDDIVRGENTSNVKKSNPSESSPTCSSSQSSDNDDEEIFEQKDWIIQDQLTMKMRQPKLYEFLHLVLNNSRYNSYASWLNKNEGLFKIHKPHQVTRLWEKVKIRKSKRTMDYDTFARAIRSYYRHGLMIKTHTKFTYRFAKM